MTKKNQAILINLILLLIIIGMIKMEVKQKILIPLIYCIAMASGMIFVNYLKDEDDV